MFASGPKGTAASGTGPNMAPHGTLMESLVLTLNVLCGRVLREGDALESPYMLSPGNTRRAQVTAPSSPTPGAPHRVRGLSGLPGEMLTNALNDEILLKGEGQVRALIVSGGNPVQAWPDQQKTLQALGDLDPIIEIAITPNRPDCAGVFGIARDLAAAGLGKLKLKEKRLILSLIHISEPTRPY